jgi:hypothetical protein
LAKSGFEAVEPLAKFRTKSRWNSSNELLRIYDRNNAHKISFANAGLFLGFFLGDFGGHWSRKLEPQTVRKFSRIHEGRLGGAPNPSKKPQPIQNPKDWAVRMDSPLFGYFFFLHLAHLLSRFARVKNAHVHAFNARQLGDNTKSQ